MKERSMIEKTRKPEVIIFTFPFEIETLIYLDMLFKKGILQIYSKFTRKKLCRRMILIKLHSKFFEITLPTSYSHVNLQKYFLKEQISGTGFAYLKIYSLHDSTFNIW